MTLTALSVSAQGGSHFVAFDCVATDDVTSDDVTSDDVAFDDVVFDDVAFCFYRDATAGRLHQTLRGTQLQHTEPPQQTHEGKKVNGIQKSRPQVQSSPKVKVNLVIKLCVIFP